MERNSATVHQLFDPNGPASPTSDRQRMGKEASLFNGSGSGGGDDMLVRVKKLEDQMTSLITDVAVIKSNYATREDISKLNVSLEGVRTELHKAVSSQTKWLIASLFIVLGAGLTIAKLIF